MVEARQFRIRRRRIRDRRRVASAAGQISVEYVLILATFGIPMILLSRLLLAVLTEFYRMVTFLVTLPWP